MDVVVRIPDMQAVTSVTLPYFQMGRKRSFFSSDVGFPSGSDVKNPPAMQKTWIQSLGWKDPLEKGILPTPVFWHGEFHGLYSPWGHKELDTTERLSRSLSMSKTF